MRVWRDSESEVASLVRGLIEPVVLLMPLRSIGERCSCSSTGADSLLPMVRAVHGLVARECVVGELKAGAGGKFV